MSSNPSKSALDIWVGRALRRTYDPALREDLPDSLLRLVGQFAPGP